MQENQVTTELAGTENAFGLNDFGQRFGEMNPMWGAVAGTGLGTLGAMGVRQFAPGMAKWSEAIGLGLGTLASGAMLMFDRTRGAGWVGMASSFLNNGLRQLEQLMFGMGGTSGYLGNVVIEPTEVLQGHGGLGLVEPEQTEVLLGDPRYSQGLPRLVGAGVDQASEHIQLAGGPALDQHAGQWGSTLFG